MSYPSAYLLQTTQQWCYVVHMNTEETQSQLLEDVFKFMQMSFFLLCVMDLCFFFSEQTKNN